MDKAEGQQSLFNIEVKSMAPLAERMRSKVLAEFVGQKHILSEGMSLYNSIKKGQVSSSIFWGPPGVGKTTLANIIAHSTDSDIQFLNAVSSGVADAKQIIANADNLLKTSGRRTYLLLDECHRWSKAQSDCVLQAIEKGTIIFIGSTTENPYVAMTSAIVSRCTVYEFKSLAVEDIVAALRRSLTVAYGAPSNVRVTDKALDFIAETASGDLRTAFNFFDNIITNTPTGSDGNVSIDVEQVKAGTLSKIYSVSRQGYYDMISAFCKSLRGSDSTAALYWFARLIEAGCDPMLLARRLVVHSSEDVGLADSNAMVVATSAMYALQHIGMPEARIPLAHAIMYVCNAPKSNQVITALGSAQEDARNYPSARVPFHLMDGNFKRDTQQGYANGYKYPHDFGGYVEQQYMPDELKNRKYTDKDTK